MAARAEQAKVALPTRCRPAKNQQAAVVTLISSNEGYPAGALAISAALEVLDSKLLRIALVTSAVNAGTRELLRSAAWEVMEVEEVACNHVLGPHVTSAHYDLGDEYRAKVGRWRSTCTKLRAWALGGLHKVIFLDADTLVLRPIDSLIDHPSAFAAAPDTFPADQFNSGVMVIQPSPKRFAELLEWNRVNGTAEGGDQCLLNDFFSEWYYSEWDHEEHGKLPWIMNVGAAHYQGYKTLTRMQSRDEPTIAHFVGGESKPWGFLMAKFQGQADRVPPSVRTLLHAWDEMYWLAKTNRICAGSVSRAEMERLRLLLETA